MNDSLTIITPTAGRESLRDTLCSYAHQMGPDDEFLVMGDGTDGMVPDVFDIMAAFDARFRYVQVKSPFHSWGHLELRTGIRMASKAFIVGNDDDDIATPNALADIRAAIAEQPYPRPLFFQFMTPWREVLWDRPELVETRVGGHMLVQPNDPERLAYPTARYSGDFDYLVSAFNHYGGDVAWIPKLIAWTRPTADELRRLIPQGVLA